MKPNQKAAWEILTEDEKTSLTLQIGLSKSSWEVGEIMTKSHYKYLEIKYRADHFLKIFADHLYLYDRLVPDVKCNPFVLLFLRKCIEERKKPLAVIAEINDTITDINRDKISKQSMNALLEEQISIWQKSEDAHEKVTLEMVKEFDRWNNFRILPRNIQEPSAYKRRVKNVYKKHIRMVTSIHPLSVKKLLKLYSANKGKCLLLPLLTPDTCGVFKIRYNQQSFKIINKIGLYLFEDEKIAKEYLSELEIYTGKRKKDCTDGLNFWPKYRQLIGRAKNYQEIQQITPNRKYLEMALSKLEYL